MSTRDSWALVCRLFSAGAPIHRAALPLQERRAISTLGSAIRSVPAGRSRALCPYCHLKRGYIVSSGSESRRCHCPDCGSIPIELDDLLSVALDETWFKRKLRVAMDIASHDGVDEISDGIWRIGNARRAPVVLARDLERIWRDPAILGRVRVLRGKTTVITPLKRKIGAAPLGEDVQWLPLQERFTLYGSGLSFIDPGTKRETTTTSDPAEPDNGPFSADFRWVTLAEWPDAPIRLTKGQAAIFEALWSFRGVKVSAQRLMARAGLSSAKPIDLFKVKPKGQVDADHVRALSAYKQLVISARREGLYWLTPEVY